MPTYLKYGSVKGDVQESGHVNWIELSAVTWGLTRPVTNPAGSTAGRVAAAPRVGELVVTKDEDIATISLFSESLSGKPSDARIDFARTGDDPFTVYYSIVMKEALITAFSQTSAGDRPLESLTLNFTSIELTGEQMDVDGSSASQASYGWNVRQNTPA